MIITIAVILFVIVGGAILSEPQNFADFFPFGPGATFRGAAMIFFAYVGFDSVSSLYVLFFLQPPSTTSGLTVAISFSTVPRRCQTQIVICRLGSWAPSGSRSPSTAGWPLLSAEWCITRISTKTHPWPWVLACTAFTGPKLWCPLGPFS